MFRILFAVACLLVAQGCSRAPDYGPTGTIDGLLTLEGKPLQPGTAVMFMHPERGFLAFGTTDAAGNYQVDSWNNGQIPVGRYRVMIQPPSVPNETADSGDLDALMNQIQQSKPLVAKADFPARYRTVAKSGLDFEVVPGVNSFQINLESP